MLARVVFSVLMIAWAAPLHSQTPVQLSGVVVSAGAGAPISGVTVEAVGEGRYTLTGSGGSFTLQVRNGERTLLRFHRLGYETLEREIDLEEAEAGRIRVELPVDAVLVDPLLVLARRTRVVGDPLGASATPGSAQYLSRWDLQERPMVFDDINSALRRIPGVTIQEEEGFGLRPNIGIRGSGTDRTSKITVMEDGVLIAPAPYAAPAAYYFPTMGRMEGIEVRKGASQVRYGPRTTGGALNLISSSIPDRPTFGGEIAGGSFGVRKGRASVGMSDEHWGVLFETYQMANDGYKQLPDGHDTGYRLEDYLGKLRINTRRDARVFQSLEFKGGVTDQLSNETYLGVTEADFSASPLMRYAASRLDNMDNEHSQVQVQHFARFPRGLDLTTVAYRNDTSRNWYKLQSVLGTGLPTVLDDTTSHAGALSILRGADSPDDALVVRANNRAYLSRGVQSVLGVRGARGRISHDLEFGVRLHRDSEDRFQWDDRFRMDSGAMTRTTAGIPGTQTNRMVEASAVAVFVQDEVRVGSLTLTPGIRFETVDFTDTNWGASDLERAGEGTVRRNSARAWIPGIGAAVEISPWINVFGGLHKGFAPPGPGMNEATEPEESWNYELGGRYRRGGMNFEGTAFLNQYRNILGSATLSSGTPGDGDLYNGGRVRAIGFESMAQADLTSATAALRIPVQATYTFSRSEFQTSFSSGFWGEVVAGDELPYHPNHQFSASVGVRGGSWGVSLSAHGASEARTEASRGTPPPNRRTDGFAVVGLAADYQLPAYGATIFAGIENLADTEYVVARVPAGLRPGLPRTLQAGLRFQR
jgi:Fe(3+) dicitrate transport protein